MNAITTPKLTLIAHNQHIFKAVEIAEYFGVKQADQDVENAVRVLNYVSPDYPECDITVDNMARVLMLMYGAPTLDTLILIDKHIMESGLEIGSRRLQIRDTTPVYTVHAEGFTVHLASSGPGFGFPLHLTLIAWKDMDDFENHQEECELAMDGIGICRCDPVVDYRKYMSMNGSNWEIVLPIILQKRWDPPGEIASSIWTRDDSGPIIGGRIFD